MSVHSIVPLMVVSSNHQCPLSRLLARTVAISGCHWCVRANSRWVVKGKKNRRKEVPCLWLFLIQVFGYLQLKFMQHPVQINSNWARYYVSNRYEFLLKWGINLTKNGYKPWIKQSQECVLWTILSCQNPI